MWAAVIGAHCAMPLGNRLVSSAPLVGGAVREEPVNDHADDGEDEDDETPKQLVRRGTVRLQDLNWKGMSA